MLNNRLQSTSSFPKMERNISKMCFWLFKPISLIRSAFLGKKGIRQSRQSNVSHLLGHGLKENDRGVQLKLRNQLNRFVDVRMASGNDFYVILACVKSGEPEHLYPLEASTHSFRLDLMMKGMLNWEERKTVYSANSPDDCLLTPHRS